MNRKQAIEILQARLNEWLESEHSNDYENVPVDKLQVVVRLDDSGNPETTFVFAVDRHLPKGE